MCQHSLIKVYQNSIPVCTSTYPSTKQWSPNHSSNISGFHSPSIQSLGTSVESVAQRVHILHKGDFWVGSWSIDRSLFSASLTSSLIPPNNTFWADKCWQGCNVQLRRLHVAQGCSNQGTPFSQWMLWISTSIVVKFQEDISKESWTRDPFSQFMQKRYLHEVLCKWLWVVEIQAYMCSHGTQKSSHDSGFCCICTGVEGAIMPRTKERGGLWLPEPCPWSKP